jgi:hypothetical protein
MKILFLGYYNENTPKGLVSRDYLKSLLTTKLDIVARPIYNDGMPLNTPEGVIDALERKSVDNCDVVLQAVRPQASAFNGHLSASILLYDFPFEPSSNHEDYTFINNMGLWLTSGPGLGGTYIPLPVNLEKVRKNYPKMALPGVGDDYLFYWSGTLAPSDNLETVLRAFHHAFSPEEPVQLLLNIDAPLQEVQPFIDRIKQELGIFKNPADYKKEIIWLGKLPEEQELSLHETGNCYVDVATHGAYRRGWLVALAKGKNVISANVGFSGTLDRISGLGRNWGEKFNVGDLSWEMRQATNGFSAIYPIHAHSFEEVGRILEENIRGIL